MLHIKVNIFPIPTPHVKKMCTTFEGYLCFLYIISSTMSFRSSLSFFHIC